MTPRRVAASFCLLALAPGMVLAQTPDAAAERARLANERIQVEAERRTQEELARADQAQGTAPTPGAATPIPAQPPASESRPAEESPQAGRPAADDARTQRALEQLRELGELKDAGYLTDEEFRRIKQRILESHF